MEAIIATVQVTEKNFEATVKQGIVLLDFWAAWCGVDTEAEPGLAAAFRIRAIPTPRRLNGAGAVRRNQRTANLPMGTRLARPRGSALY